MQMWAKKEISCKCPGNKEVVGDIGRSYPIPYYMYCMLSTVFLVWVQASGNCQCERRGFDPWVGRIPWRRKYPLQYSCLENLIA